MAVYLVAIYMNEKVHAKFEKDYRSTGKRLDVGSSCVRFKKLNDLPLDLIGKAIAIYKPDEFVAMFIEKTDKRKKAEKK